MEKQTSVFEMMNFKNKKIFVAGGTGFIGQRVVKRLEEEKMNYVTASLDTGIDFRDRNQTEKYFREKKPEVIINCAAFVGGIKFGLEHRGEIFYNNTLINANLIECSREYKLKRFINPISNCSYPDLAKRKFREEDWWKGSLHPSVLVYGFIKKGTWVQSYAYHDQYGMDFINLLLPNMYGPGDHFDETKSHALGALIMKMVRAKEENLPEVVVWGTGRPIREWLYVDDCVEVFLRALEMQPVLEPINIGQGTGISIAELAKVIKKIVGYRGKLVFDPSKPDGASYKVMNVERMKKIFNWIPPTKLEDGIRTTIDWYYKNIVKR